MHKKLLQALFQINLAGEKVKEELNWKSNPFEVPKDILSNWRSLVERGSEIRKEWDVQFANQEFKSGSSPIVFDKSGKSMEHIDQYIFKDGAIAKIGCREFSSEMKQLDNDQDDFSIFYESANFTKWHKLHLIKLLSEG